MTDDDVYYMTAAETEEAVLERIRTEGANQAVETGLAVLRDPKAPAAAKATIMNTFLRIGGYFERPADLGDDDFAGMSLSHLQAVQQRLARQLKVAETTLSALATPVEVLDLSPADTCLESINVFD